jgi:phage shock protein A
MSNLSRIAMIIRSNLNHAADNTNACADYDPSFANNSKIVPAGLGLTGAAIGSSLGNAGILAGGTGFAVNSLALGGLGGLTGLAIYEVIRICAEGDGQSLAGGVAGAVAGAGLSSTIGGVGVAVGGTAFGMGVGSMALAGGIAGLGLVGLVRLLHTEADLSTALDLAIADMAQEVQQIRASVNQADANYLATYRLTQKKHEAALAEVEKWQQRVKLARAKGEIYLAQQAEARVLQAKRNAEGIGRILADSPQPKSPNHGNLQLLEAKLAEAKMNRYNLLAAINHAKAEAMIDGL